MARLGSPNLNKTYNTGALPDTKGGGKVLAVEIVSADPTLVSGQPRVWFNTTDNKLKISPDGVNTKSVQLS